MRHPGIINLKFCFQLVEEETYAYKYNLLDLDVELDQLEWINLSVEITYQILGETLIFISKIMDFHQTLAVEVRSSIDFQGEI